MLFIISLVNHNIVDTLFLLKRIIIIIILLIKNFSAYGVYRSDLSKKFVSCQRFANNLIISCFQTYIP